MPFEPQTTLVGTPATLTRAAARRALAIGASPVEAAVRAKVATCLKDFLASCFAAINAEAMPSVERLAALRRDAAEAHALGTGVKTSAETAALLNGMLSHSLIRDDMHGPSGTHPGVVIFPALLAAAERHQLSGQALVRGIVAGYQVMGALGTAVRTGLTNRRFRPLGISGPYGAAAGIVAATSMGEHEAVHALGLAANFASGLNQWPWSGGQEIHVHSGMAARNALTAFDLAHAGVLASEDIIEGRDGLFAAYGSNAQAPQIFHDRLAGDMEILNVTHKPFAGCNFIQTSVAAAAALHATIGAPDVAQIAKVVITTFRAARDYPGCNNPGPFTSVRQSKMSLQYGVCAALRWGTFDEASAAAFADESLLRLLAVCEIEMSAAYEHDVPRLQPAKVTLTMHDGRIVESELTDVPWLSPQAVDQRFRADAARHLSATEIDRLAELIGTLAELPDLSELFDILGRAVAEPTHTRRLQPS